MIPFILHPGTTYTDTESIFSETEIPKHLISKDRELPNKFFFTI